MKQILLIAMLALLTACQGDMPNQALGTLERDRVLLRATASEIITALPLSEGSLVQKGDLLVQFDTRKQESRVSIAKAEVNKAQAYL